MIQQEISTQENEEECTEITIRACSHACISNNVECEFSECEHWISFGEDHNCDLISIKKHGPLTLRQVGERMGVSYVRIKQIEDAALKKIRESITLEDLEN